MTATFGDFLTLADQHITASLMSRGRPAGQNVGVIVAELSRLVSAMARYGSADLQAQAIQLAHSTAGPAIVAAIESGHTFTGARTTYVFSPTEHVGESVSSLSLFKGGLPCNVTCLAAPGVSLGS